jgi:hypothetical protein
MKRHHLRETGGGGRDETPPTRWRENKMDLSSIELSIMAVITYLKQNSAILNTLYLARRVTKTRKQYVKTK